MAGSKKVRCAVMSIHSAELLLKVCKLALLEFDLISYQIKADPRVIAVIKAAVARAEREIHG